MTAMKAPLMSRSRILIAALLGFGSLAANHLLAASFSLEPTADAFVTTGPSGTFSVDNFGGAGALSVASAGHSAGEFQSVLRFNLAGARSAFDSQFGAGQWTVSSVQLQLTPITGNSFFNPSGAGQFHISWMQNDSWLEGTGRPRAPTTDGITFNSLQFTIGAQDQDLGVFNFPGGIPGAATYTLRLGSGLSGDVLAGTDADFRIFAPDTSVSFLFCSRSNIRNPSGHPLLTISATAVPEPGSAALAALGAALFFSLRAKR
jgi:hypothetical protein